MASLLVTSEVQAQFNPDYTFNTGTVQAEKITRPGKPAVYVLSTSGALTTAVPANNMVVSITAKVEYYRKPAVGDPVLLGTVDMTIAAVSGSQNYSTRYPFEVDAPAAGDKYYAVLTGVCTYAPARGGAQATVNAVAKTTASTAFQ